MRALLWKDFRLLRSLIVLSCVLYTIPYAALLIRSATESESVSWSLLFTQASKISLLITGLVAAVLGGNVVAAERMDGSDEFLRYLPPTRLKSLMSKATITIGLVSAMVALNLLVLLKAVADLPSDTAAARFAQDDLDGAHLLAGTIALQFCTAWLASMISHNPSLAAFAGLVGPLLIWLPGQLLLETGNISPMQFEALYMAGTVIVGLAAFVMGVMIYRRI